MTKARFVIFPFEDGAVYPHFGLAEGTPLEGYPGANTNPPGTVLWVSSRAQDNQLGMWQSVEVSLEFRRTNAPGKVERLSGFLPESKRTQREQER